MSHKNKRLQQSLWDIQRRWGSQAIRPASALSSSPASTAIKTGFTTLDAALGSGGIVRSRLTELVGTPTSGMTTLAHKITASAQDGNEGAAYLDLGGTLDPDYAVRCGVQVERLLIVRPESALSALNIARDLCKEGGLGLIVIDAARSAADFDGIPAFTTVLRQLDEALIRASCSLALLRTPAIHAAWHLLDPYVHTRLRIERTAWLHHLDDVNGYRARVTVLKDKTSAGEKQVSIDITFDEIVNGDGA